MTKTPFRWKYPRFSPSLHLLRHSAATSMATLSSLSFTTSLFGFFSERSKNFRTQIPVVYTRESLGRLVPVIGSTLSSARVENARRAITRRRLPIVFASSDAEPPEEQDAIKKSETSGQGPPFLTILAALVVLLLILWVVGSTLLWLIGLIVNVPPRS